MLVFIPLNYAWIGLERIFMSYIFGNNLFKAEQNSSKVYGSSAKYVW